MEDLNSAKSWSTVDLIGGGILADIAKYDKLDNVQANVKRFKMPCETFVLSLQMYGKKYLRIFILKSGIFFILQITFLTACL